MGLLDAVGLVVVLEHRSEAPARLLGQLCTPLASALNGRALRMVVVALLYNKQPLKVFLRLSGSVAVDRVALKYAKI